MNHAINWCLAVAMALVLSTAYLLDGPSDIQAAIDAAADAKATQREQLAMEKFSRAAQAMCGGENATWKLLDNGSVQCFTKRGFRTQIK
tara:strand:- start:105 stop:371 length:267 start_codon:yes stop_codon:yes gene_type:complete